MDHLVSSSEEETLVKDQFNIPVVNVIWRMVASKTFPLKSEEGMKLTHMTFLCGTNRGLKILGQLSSGSKFMALMEELFTNTLSFLALFPYFGKLLVKNQIKRR